MNASPAGTAAPGWLATARRPEIVRRALRVAIVVGSVLAAINYADRLLAGTLTRGDLFKIALTFAVPYCVSTWSSVETMRSPR